MGRKSTRFPKFKHVALFYLIALSIPLALGAAAYQAARYAALEEEVVKIQTAQAQWIENNKRLIAGIAVLSAPARIEKIARDQLGLKKITPEQVTQVRIRKGSTP